MAITRQGVGTLTYGTTSLSMTSYPASVAVGDLLILFVGMKPSSANAGSVSTPAGWSYIGSLLGAGGYTTTLGADTGNTHLYAFARKADGTETSFTVTGNTSNSMWGQILRYSTSTSGWKVDFVSASDTAGGSVSMAFSTFGMLPVAGDHFVTAMCTPSDIGAGAQFSAEAFSATGVTFGTVVEVSEPFSALGNDIGGLIASVPVTTGSISAITTTFTATAGGTTTNVRGPGLLLRLRDGIVPAAFDTLVDDFNDNSRDTTKWPTQALTSGTITETNQRTELAPGASSSNSQDSAYKYYITDSSVLAQVTPQAGTMTTAGLWLRILHESSSDVIYFGVNAKANTTSWKYLTGGFTQQWLDSVAGGYDATSHAWIRLRESGGNLLFDTSPDGTTWTNQFSRATPTNFVTTFGSLGVDMFAERGTGTPSTNALVDNFNIAPSSGPPPGQFLPFFGMAHHDDELTTRRVRRRGSGLYVPHQRELTVARAA